MTAKSLISVALCFLLATACDENSPTGPTVPLNQQFTLAPAQSASIAGTSLRIEFLRVSGDSRCPADAFCILGGDATVHIRANSSGSSTDYGLHTGDASHAVAFHAGFRIQLVSLQPYPFSSRTIPPEEYRATLNVSR